MALLGAQKRTSAALRYVIQHAEIRKVEDVTSNQ